jgi:hypothetical protein
MTKFYAIGNVQITDDVWYIILYHKISRFYEYINLTIFLPTTYKSYVALVIRLIMNDL